MATLLYFAYGSNMLSRRLKHCGRAPSARRRAVGFITGHRLTFDKRSKDKSGKCDAETTGTDTDRVWGVLFDVDDSEKGQLDAAEGLGHGYAKKTVSVVVGSETFEADMYYATDKDPSLQPYDWYKDYVVFGAREHGLPAEYIERIERVPAVEDPNPDRSARERAILRGD